MIFHSYVSFQGGWKGPILTNTHYPDCQRLPYNVRHWNGVGCLLPLPWPVSLDFRCGTSKKGRQISKNRSLIIYRAWNYSILPTQWNLMFVICISPFGAPTFKSARFRGCSPHLFCRAKLVGWLSFWCKKPRFCSAGWLGHRLTRDLPGWHVPLHGHGVGMLGTF